MSQHYSAVLAYCPTVLLTLFQILSLKYLPGIIGHYQRAQLQELRVLLTRLLLQLAKPQQASFLVLSKQEPFGRQPDRVHSACTRGLLRTVATDILLFVVVWSLVRGCGVPQ